MILCSWVTLAELTFLLFFSIELYSVSKSVTHPFWSPICSTHQSAAHFHHVIIHGYQPLGHIPLGYVETYLCNRSLTAIREKTTVIDDVAKVR